MKLKLIIAAAVFSSSVVMTGCREEFADINTDPSSISTGDPNFLFTQAILNFEPSDYTFWFYNAPMMYKWGEIGIGSSGFGSTFHQTTEYGGQGSQTYNVLLYVRDIENYLKQQPADVAAGYQQQLAALKTLCIYLGIFDADMYGDMPYNEACLARYTSPSLLTPAYDKVEALYNQWLEELEEYTETLTTAANQNWIAKQDIIYGGNAAKWAKLANSLRLKIAVRLVTKNKTKALEIAKQVATSSAGVLDGTADDFLFNKATTIVSDDGDKVYHFGNGVLGSYLYPTKLVTDFMLKNKDPRIRFFFSKNGYNAKVVQAFFDQGVNLPSFIAANVEYTVDGNGKKVFSKWAGPGEPWVRYYGLPVVMDANQNSQYDGYFNTTPYTLEKNSVRYTYRSTSQFNEEMVRGRVDYEVPSAPGDTPVKDADDNPWYGMYMSTAEVNLYLAELSLLGATLPKTAEEYYNKAVEASVEEYNRLAALNKIPYYGTTYGYDPHEKVIDLKAGEISAMMASPEVAFTGTTAQKLEKVYIQQILHLMYFPSDQFCVIRRSGIPARNSSIFKWTDFSEPTPTEIPRRFEVSTPSVTDLMYEIKKKAYSDQGFTSGTSIETRLLNSERVWQDVGAPNFGDGPTN